MAPKNREGYSVVFKRKVVEMMVNGEDAVSLFWPNLSVEEYKKKRKLVNGWKQQLLNQHQQ